MKGPRVLLLTRLIATPCTQQGVGVSVYGGVRERLAVLRESFAVADDAPCRNFAKLGGRWGESVGSNVPADPVTVPVIFPKATKQMVDDAAADDYFVKETRTLFLNCRDIAIALPESRASRLRERLDGFDEIGSQSNCDALAETYERRAKLRPVSMRRNTRHAIARSGQDSGNATRLRERKAPTVYQFSDFRVLCNRTACSIPRSRLGRQRESDEPRHGPGLNPRCRS